jgi:hypothetical protein
VISKTLNARFVTWISEESVERGDDISNVGNGQSLELTNRSMCRNSGVRIFHSEMRNSMTICAMSIEQKNRRK